MRDLYYFFMNNLPYNSDFKKIEKQVLESDVLITDGTHRMVGLFYDIKTMSSPKITLQCLRSEVPFVKQVAFSRGIRIIKQEQLSALLFRRHHIGESLKQEFFSVVAEIYSEIDAKKRKIEKEREQEKECAQIIEEAINGNSNAQCWLGLKYHTGEGIPRDDKLAMEWYFKASSQDDGFSEYCLGIHYERGLGTRRNIKKAAQFYRMAVEKNFEGAAEELESLKQKGLLG